MKKLKYVTIGTVIVCLLVTGCSKSNINVDIETVIKSSKTIVNENLKEDVKTDTFVLTVWSDNFDKNYIEQQLKEIYPKAEVNVVNIDGMDSQKIIKSLAEGPSPDVVLYYADSLGSLNALDVFEDLSQAKYKIEDMKYLFNQQELDQSMSFDGKKLITLPFTSAPLVTYYRKDILDQYGIPTDPKELGDFMEKPENWMKIAKALKKDNKFALQWTDEFIKIALKGYGYFDKDMNLMVDNEKAKVVFKVTKEAYDLGVVGNNDIWSEQGKKAVKDGEIAMLYLNKWGSDYIKEIAPETDGKWRVTRLPLGLNCYAGTNNISILSSSKYKMQAWDLVKKLVRSERSYNDNIRNEKNEFLGGQQSNLLYEDLANKIPRRYPTILDDKVRSIIIDSMNSNMSNYLDNYSNVEAIVDSNKSKANDVIYSEQKILSDYLIKNRKP